MAEYSVTRSGHKTLTANTVDVVTLNQDFSAVEVLNRDLDADLFFTVDGTTPTVSGDGTFIARPGQGVTVEVPGSGPTDVRVISDAAVEYSVTGVAGGS